MANIAEAELCTMILQHIGELAVGQTASADDTAIIERAVEAAHDRLNKLGLVPFPLTLIPPWAQIPLRDYVAIDCLPTFGRPVDRLPDGTSPIQTAAMARLFEQVAGYKHRKPVRATYY